MKTLERYGWHYLTGDVDWEDHGGMWYKQARDGAWWVLRFENMDAWGDGASGYRCEVLRVDISEVAAEKLHRALACCGRKFSAEEMAVVCDGNVIARFDAPHFSVVLLDSLISYGVYAPMTSFVAPHRPLNVRAAARREADALMRDAQATEDRLDRQFNAIGDTCRDAGRGVSIIDEWRKQKKDDAA